MARKRTSTEQPTLLDSASYRRGAGIESPLADRLRPRTLAELVGHDAVLGPGTLLGDAIASDRVGSMILWGPPGSGKTSLAHVVSELTQSEFVPFSAVLGGVPELREIIAAAKERRAFRGQRTTLFVDEIHRFNKAQQDAFLPHVEAGTITLIGATTENPSFAVNAAVLSRAKVVRLEALGKPELETLLRRAVADERRGLGALGLTVDEDALSAIAEQARGDARRALGLLEAVAHFVRSQGDERSDASHVTLETVRAAEVGQSLLYDKRGEEHYNVVSALIKSMRGSDPDASVYWLMRMLEAGDDPLFVMRRLIIFASEDVGNADPRALDVAINADAAFRRLGMPEGLYPIAHACLYLASCPKSNAVGKAFKAARADIDAHGALPVPPKLRNAVTGLMKEHGYGAGYQYAHDFAGGFVPGETYLPEALTGRRYYQPSSQGLEAAIADRLARIRSVSAPEPTVAAPPVSKPPDDE